MPHFDLLAMLILISCAGKCLEISGTPDQRERAKLYVMFLIEHRRTLLGGISLGGCAVFDYKKHRDDMTVLEIPENSLSSVKGTSGVNLKQTEDISNALVFYVRLPRDFVVSSTGEADVTSLRDADPRDDDMHRIVLFGGR